MAWIKRNLFFAVGSAVAILLMGCAGWYLFSEWSSNQKSQAELEETYSQLEQVTHQNPSPGTAGGKVDNQKIAEDQIKQLAEINRKLSEHFKVIPPIPNSTNVSAREFAIALPGVMANLANAAKAASVELPPQFAFSFTKQTTLTSFAPGSVQPLAVQLGEVKAICDILFAAKINVLQAVRRESISTDDAEGNAADYVTEKSKTTELATVSPYEVTFDCFGAELVAVMAGFANSPYCIGVSAMAVEPATDRMMGYAGGYGGGYVPTTDVPRTARTTDTGGYGGYAPAAGGYGNPLGGAVVPTRTGPVTILDEQKLRVTLTLQVVKLKSKPKL